MRINGVMIDDTHCEAFTSPFARILVTAKDDYWLDMAVRSATGMATSIIGCDAEGGLEIKTNDTPDGRPGALLMFFARKADTLEKSLLLRIGQGVMTCPATAVFNAMDGTIPTRTGHKLKFFGDGHEKQAQVRGRDGWVIPVTEGEFFVEDTFYIAAGIAGGAFMIIAKDQDAALDAARKAAAAIAPISGVITPFPGGVARCASKAGSQRYPFLKASTNAAFCPTLIDKVETKLPQGAGCVLEIVVDGESLGAVRSAMKAGMAAACGVKRVILISAANFGGKLGDVKIGLRELMG
ncbi:MAG: formylmethanofuran--tetrahydromethanopterin N-formyltransferase [Nitrospinae bacterium]|nr:formylmethanofuran--tetrahydromethanopterin N-formyltransferase [Nitrospinota bacterium]